MPSPQIVLAEAKRRYRPYVSHQSRYAFLTGHFRLPNCIRGKRGTRSEPRAFSNEEEGYGRNAGCKRH
jgi:hypothetical protein